MQEKKNEIIVKKSSGNIFADLGFADAEERFQKAKIAYEIEKRIDELKWNDQDAASFLQMEEEKIGKIIRGNLKDFSADFLMNIFDKLYDKCSGFNQCLWNPGLWNSDRFVISNEKKDLCDFIGNLAEWFHTASNMYSPANQESEINAEAPVAA